MKVSKALRLTVCVSCMFIACCAINASANIITNGLVASYPFNGNADDVSGNGYDGTVQGATLTADRFGSADSAYNFNGVDNYISLGTMGGMQSVSMWIRQDPRESFEFYFGHDTFRLYASINTNGRLMFGDGSPQKVYTTISMDDYVDEWVHVVAIQDGYNSMIFFNGTDVTQSSGNIGPAQEDIVNLGRWPGPSPSATHYFNGDIDDVAVFNRALSEEEVTALHEAIPEPASAGLIVLVCGCGLMIRRWFIR